MNEQLSREINIDSLLLRLPLQYVTILNQSLTDKHQDYTVNETTGTMKEKLQRYKPSEFHKQTIERKGYKFDFHVKKNKHGTKNLYMLVNAKMLETKYFQGITILNVKEVYDRLIACEMAYFTFEDFLKNSRCTSIEFCKNFRMKNLSIQLTELNSRLKKTAKQNPLPKLKKGTKQQSLRFVQKDDATNAKPHIFIYNKEQELMNKSYEFDRAYLQNENIEELCRVEFRIKDFKHAKFLGIKDNSLYTLLRLSSQVKEEILHKFTMCFLDLPKSKQKIKLTPNKQIYLNCMKALLKENKTFGLVAEILTNDLPSNRKSEKHKELKELYYNHIYKPVDVAKSEGEIYDILQLYFDKARANHIPT